MPGRSWEKATGENGRVFLGLDLTEQSAFLIKNLSGS
jgi:hypothetical protein